MLLTLSSENSESPRSVASEISEKDAPVISADVRRSVAFWDIHQHMKPSKRIQKRRRLALTIKGVAASLPEFRYYQGLHDVCLVMLEVANDNVNEAVRFSNFILRNAFLHLMQTDFTTSLLPTVEQVKEIVRREDSELSKHVERSPTGYYVVIPWILTWFSHSVVSFDNLCRIFAFLAMAGDRDTVSLLCASILICNRHNFREAAVAHDSDYHRPEICLSAGVIDRAIDLTKKLRPIRRDNQPLKSQRLSLVLLCLVLASALLIPYMCRFPNGFM